MLPILRYWLTLRVDKVLMMWQQRVTFLFIPLKISFHTNSQCEMKFSMLLARFVLRSCCRPKQRLSLRSIFLSVIGPWEKIWHGNKTTCSGSNPVQSCRSKMTTCQRMSVSAASAQIWVEQHSYTERLQMAARKNLETGDVRRDSESITTKLCSQMGCKWNAIFENHVVTSIDRTRFDFQF